MGLWNERLQSRESHAVGLRKKAGSPNTAIFQNESISSMSHLKDLDY